MEFSFLSRNVRILKFFAILPVFLTAFICRLHSPFTCSNSHPFHSSLHLHLSIQQSTHLFTRLFHYYRTSNLFFASTLSQAFILLVSTVQPFLYPSFTQLCTHLLFIYPHPSLQCIPPPISQTNHSSILFFHSSFYTSFQSTFTLHQFLHYISLSSRPPIASI